MKHRTRITFSHIVPFNSNATVPSDPTPIRNDLMDLGAEITFDDSKPFNSRGPFSRGPTALKRLRRLGSGYMDLSIKEETSLFSIKRSILAELWSTNDPEILRTVERLSTPERLIPLSSKEPWAKRVFTKGTSGKVVSKGAGKAISKSTGKIVATGASKVVSKGPSKNLSEGTSKNLSKGISKTVSNGACKVPAPVGVGGDHAGPIGAPECNSCLEPNRRLDKVVAKRDTHGKVEKVVSKRFRRGKVINDETAPPSKVVFRLPWETRGEGASTNVAKEVSIDHNEPIDTRGYFSDLFLGTHRKLGKVALKRLRRRGRDNDEGDVEALVAQEATIWTKLRHKFILRCLGTFTRLEHVYIVSPFMKNGTMLDWIRSKNPEGRARLKMLCELANALAYLHTRGIVHGDIKANNVLVSNDARIQLCDFGLAKLAGSKTTSKLKGAGTFRWQSPELLEDESKTTKSDVYAFAMTIVEVQTGLMPFPELSNIVAFVKAVCIQGARPKRPSQAETSEFSIRAWDVAELCWHADPDQRMSMPEVAFRLKYR